MERFILLTLCLFISLSALAEGEKSFDKPDCIFEAKDLPNLNERMTLYEINESWNTTFFILGNDAFFDLLSDPSQQFSMLFDITTNETLSSDYEIFTAFTKDPSWRGAAINAGITKLNDINSAWRKTGTYQQNKAIKLVVFGFDTKSKGQVKFANFDNAIVACSI